jgi:hypothetical protein
MPQDCANPRPGENPAGWAVEKLSDEQIMVEVQRGNGDAFNDHAIKALAMCVGDDPI